MAPPHSISDSVSLPSVLSGPTKRRPRGEQAEPEAGEAAEAEAGEAAEAEEASRGVACAGQGRGGDATRRSADTGGELDAAAPAAAAAATVDAAAAGASELVSAPAGTISGTEVLAATRLPPLVLQVWGEEERRGPLAYGHRPQV